MRLKLTWQPLTLHLRHAFTISRETATKKHNVLVTISDGEHIGYGEAAPSLFYGEDANTVGRALNSLQETVEEGVGNFPEILENLSKAPPPAPAAKAALDIALHDLWAKREGLPLYRLLGLPGHIDQPTSFTIGMDSLPVILQKVREAEPYPVLKVKMGMEGDLDMVIAIRGATSKTIRVDANGGWGWEEAAWKIEELAKLEVEYVEQPLPKGDLEGLAFLRGRASLPIFVDEDALTAADLPALEGLVDGINLKLMKCGGIRPALDIIHEARRRNLRLMIGCMIESSVAITAGAHLASQMEYIDLDGNLLIADDPFAGVTCTQGWLALPDAPGLGVVLRNNSYFSPQRHRDTEE